jgi:hypothetical protein
VSDKDVFYHDGTKNKANFMDQSGTEGLRGVSRRGAEGNSSRPDHRRRRPEGRYCQTHEGNGMFQKKSKTGIKTPKQETDLIEARLKRLREMLK